MIYNIIKEKLDKLNHDISHFSCSNDICTPMNLVEEMIDKIPEELWNRDCIKILDPCAGNGNFPAYLLTKINEKSIIDANEINIKRIKNLQNIKGINILTKDFFDFNNEEKYDLIIANPPYAKFTDGKRAAKNHSISKDFVKKSLDLLKHNGYLVYIIPDNWMSLSDRNDLAKILSEYQFIYLNIHGAKKYFKSVGSSFTWFVLKKEKNEREFVIDNFYKQKEKSYVKLNKGIESIPLFYNNIVKSIIEKTLNKNNKKFNIETSSNLHKYTKKNNLKNVKTEDFKYKIWHTPTQQIWSNKKHKYQNGYKVFISLTSYYSTFVDEAGMTQSIAFILCQNKKEAENIKKTLQHPLYVFLNNIHRYGNFNNIRILQKFPYSTKNPYKEFNISLKEQKFIENFI